MRQIKICLVPNVSGVGGMVSFRNKLSVGLAQRGIDAGDDLSDPVNEAVLVIGGTRQMGALWRARRRGLRIVQRLNGMNWLHRVRKTGLRHYLRAEYGNLILRLIRDYLADRVVYQSNFARCWWEKTYGEARVPSSVIYNGVDLNLFKPGRAPTLPEDRVRVLVVEGNIGGGYELGLDRALGLVLELAQRLDNAHSQYGGSRVELMVVGQVGKKLKIAIQSELLKSHPTSMIILTWVGVVNSQQVAQLDRSAHLFYSADINAACPNSVIEALACGTPVIAHDTGALPELTAAGAGKVTPYGGDPWKLDEPDMHSLGHAALEILLHRDSFSRAARDRAESLFGLDKMVDGYLDVLLG
ncbi:MAG TPA: glycosyltransferase family 4 protein [Anaerolineales bacterium]